jgi:hypothetical protein
MLSWSDKRSVYPVEIKPHVWKASCIGWNILGPWEYAGGSDERSKAVRYSHAVFVEYMQPRNCGGGNISELPTLHPVGRPVPSLAARMHVDLVGGGSSDRVM